MATVTSLTEAKIQELMSGWEGVSLSQDEINALVQQLWNNNETQDANLTEFRDVILPQLEADLAAGSIQVSDLNDNIVPSLQAELDQHQLNLTNLNTVDIPELNTKLNSNSNWILEFDEVTVPALQAQLDANTGSITELNDVTLPGLNQRLTDVEATAGGSDFDPTYLQSQIDANTGSINDLNTVSLPALDSRLDTLETAPGFDDTALQNQLDILNGKFPVVGDDIAADTITANQIAADAVTANEIASRTITALEIAVDTITANEIAADSITANEIASRTITALEIMADAITANEIAADTITANEIAADAITASEIASRTITALEIATDTITANEIQADSITASEIASRTITALEIAADTITANEIAADTITANEMKADSITAREIAADSVTANEIAGRTITALEIATDAITANEIAGRTITALEIATDAITANEIATDTITANEIATDAITANEIAGRTITALEIATGTITANEVGTDILIANTVYSRAGYFGTIDAEQLTSGSVTAEIGLLGKMQVGQIAIDPAIGIQVPGPNGITLLSATGVGHAFAGSVTTDDVTINGGLTVNAKNNTINGEVKLSNVVVPPTVAPAVSNYWPYTTPTGADVWGLSDTTDGTRWLTRKLTDNKFRTYDKVTGAQVEVFDYDSWNANYQVLNMCRVGNYYFMIAYKPSDNKWWLCRVGNLFGSFTALTDITGYTDDAYRLAVGEDKITGNVMVAYKASNQTDVRVITYTTAGVQVSSELWLATDLDGSNWSVDQNFFQSVGRGLIGPNGEDQVFMQAGAEVRFWDYATKRITWWPGYPESPKGVCFEYNTTNKLRFLGYNTYRVYEWVREASWPSNVPIGVTYSWFDSKLAGTGKHETTPAPVKNHTNPLRWAALQVDASAPSNTGGDDSPDSVVIYMDNHRQPEVPVGKSSNVFRQKVISNVAPKATNEFAALGVASYPGSILSAATLVDGVTPRFKVTGAGTGNWGDLVVDGNGKAVIGGDTGWIPVTVFTNLWENYGGTWPTVAYRKIGNRVFLRGLIRGPGTLGGTMFTLPAGFRPTGDCMFAATTAQWLKQIDAVGDGSKDTDPKGTGTSGTSHFHNITAYDIRTTIDVDNIATRCDVKATGEVQHQGGLNNWSGSAWMSLFGISFFID